MALADRRSKALVDHVEALRLALCTARRERPFSVDAIVVLPDHFTPQAVRGPAMTTTRRKSRAARSVHLIMFEAAYRLPNSSVVSNDVSKMRETPEWSSRPDAGAKFVCAFWMISR